MKKALYPGSFDPITFGHIDIVKRALNIFDEITILVAYNIEKKNSLLTPDERVMLIEEEFKDEPRVKVVKYQGLTVNACEKFGINTIVRGLRMLTDFEYEYGMALTNKELDRNIESVYFMTSIEYTYLSSTVAKEVMAFGGDASKFIPQHVIDYIQNKLSSDVK